MKILVALHIVLSDGGDDDLEFFVEWSDRPIPRVDDKISFDLHHYFLVNRVQYMFPADGAAADGPEIWLYCRQGQIESAMGYTQESYRQTLSEFAAVTWED